MNKSRPDFPGGITAGKSLAEFRACLLYTSPLAESGRPVHPADGSVKVEDVVFSYDNENNALDGVSIEARPGETIALVGPSGGGKTTLASLIARFWDCLLYTSRCV